MPFSASLDWNGRGSAPYKIFRKRAAMAPLVAGVDLGGWEAETVVYVCERRRDLAQWALGPAKTLAATWLISLIASRPPLGSKSRCDRDRL